MESRMTIEMNHRGELVIPAGFDRTELRALIDKAQEANSDLHAAELRIQNAVTQLRKIGASWTVIGNILGMTRGGAQKRFGTPRKTFVFDPEDIPEDMKSNQALLWTPKL
jgi:hypothetical protein